eukprot:scaffold75113_cov45-Phaeocystis_antarctica.AAC.1
MRTTKTGRRAPPFTALGVRLGLSGRCEFCDWPPTCGSARHLTAEGCTASHYSHENRGVSPRVARVGATWARHLCRCCAIVCGCEATSVRKRRYKSCAAHE